mmetsp:Transcript_32417/g.77474  ORF Transcript_32417/g.77474 Transcript_32417/m.77474 type:complete len:267 (+) Transcript_32417:82-882(+)
MTACVLRCRTGVIFFVNHYWHYSVVSQLHREAPMHRLPITAHHDVWDSTRRMALTPQQHFRSNLRRFGNRLNIFGLEQQLRNLPSRVLSDCLPLVWHVLCRPRCQLAHELTHFSPCLEEGLHSLDPELVGRAVSDQSVLEFDLPRNCHVARAPEEHVPHLAPLSLVLAEQADGRCVAALGCEAQWRVVLRHRGHAWIELVRVRIALEKQRCGGGVAIGDGAHERRVDAVLGVVELIVARFWRGPIHCHAVLVDERAHNIDPASLGC